MEDAWDWAEDNWRPIAAVVISVVTYGAASSALWGISGYAWAAAGGFAAGMISSGGDLQAGLIGAVSGAAFYGIGQTVGQGASWGNPGKMFQKVVAHGLVGGGISVAQGGKFGTGFVSTGVSAFFAPEIAEIGNAAVGTLVSAAIGGTVAVLGGGKFANGAVTSAFSYALNQAMQAQNQKQHAAGVELEIKNWKQKALEL